MPDDILETGEIEHLVVRSENDAFYFLKAALSAELEDQPYELVFDGWPLLTLRFVGEGYESTITPQIAAALVELQHAMNRSYAQLVRNSSNANVLTKEERQNLDFKAKVDEGSSIITVDMGEYAGTIAAALAGKMTGTEIIIAVLGVAAMAASTVAYKSFLKTRSDDRKVDQQTRQIVDLSREETKRTELLTSAMQANSGLQASKQDFDDFRHEVLKSVGDAQSIDMQGVSLDREQARVVASTPRSKSTDVQLNGQYRISQLDWSKQDQVRISLYSVGSVQLEFVASMSIDNLSEEIKEKLKACEWDKQPVHFSINGTMLRGEVTTAVIVGVDWPGEAAS